MALETYLFTRKLHHELRNILVNLETNELFGYVDVTSTISPKFVLLLVFPTNLSCSQLYFVSKLCFIFVLPKKI